mgnify:CR=1 FL=1|tara:strand:- start:130 stop:675 length:546 start_codon:yes stop_codon:yes gene_type:complete
MDPILQHHFKNISEGKAVKNKDGSLSTVYTRQVDINGVPTLIPSVWNGKILNEKDAIKRAIDSGINWPTRKTHEKLRAYDIKLHKDMKPITSNQARRNIMGLKLSKKRVQGGKELDIGAKKKKKKLTEGEQYMSTEYTRNPGPKLKKVSKRGGGDFNIEMKIPKELVNQGVMYGYKKGGQI